MVPSVLKPASSAFLAQSRSLLPSVPGTVLGRPIPMSTHYLRWRHRRMDCQVWLQSKHARPAGAGGQRLTVSRENPEVASMSIPGGGGGPAGRRQHRAARDPGQVLVVDRHEGRAAARRHLGRHAAGQAEQELAHPAGQQEGQVPGGRGRLMSSMAEPAVTATPVTWPPRRSALVAGCRRPGPGST